MTGPNMTLQAKNCQQKHEKFNDTKGLNFQQQKYITTVVRVWGKNPKLWWVGDTYTQALNIQTYFHENEMTQLFIAVTSFCPITPHLNAIKMYRV